MRWRPNGLWKNPDFEFFWAGQTISKMGSGVTGIALPLTAVFLLKATPVQMGILSGLSGLAVLLFSLMAGVWVDRLRRRPLMILMDLGRAILLGSIPLAAFLGALQITQLYLVAACVGVLTVFFEAAAATMLPSLVHEAAELVEGNSKLGMSDALAEIVGPSLAGTLVQLLSAPLAITLDALSFLVSAFCLQRMRTPETAPDPQEERKSVWHESREGLHFLWGSPILRTLAGATGLFNFTGMFIGTLYALYVVRILHVPPIVLGFLIATGGVSALFGAWFAERVIRRLGLGRSIGIGLTLYGLTGLSLPLAAGPLGFVVGLLFAGQLIGDVTISIHQIGELSLRQALIPSRLQGRVNASIQFITLGVLPLGSLLAGILAERIGIRWTLFIGVSGVIVAGLWICFSPVWRVRLPEQPVLSLSDAQEDLPNESELSLPAGSSEKSL